MLGKLGRGTGSLASLNLIRDFTSLRLGAVAVVSIALLSSTSAFAQVGTSNTTAVPTGNQLGDIVVTATKRETNLQKTPIAISVVNAQSLSDRHALSFIDLADGSIPSLRVATFESRQSALTVGIRGIVPGDANQTARDQGVGVYLDGVYLGRQQGLNAALLDIERIEVLKGSQGTLFGRNTEGGAVSIITKAPSGKFGGSTTGGFGNYGSYTGQVHLDFPAFANLAFKVDGLVEHQGATTKNPLAGQTGWNYHNDVGGRIAARWKPVEGFTADFSYDRVRDENTPFFSQVVNYNPLGKTVGQYVLNPTTSKYVLVAPGTAAGVYTACSTCIAPLSPLYLISGHDRQTASEIGVVEQPSVNRNSGLTAAFRYKVSSNLELRSISAYRKTSADQWDANGPHRTIFAPNANFSRYSLSFLRQHQFSQEVQAVGTLAQFDYAVGLYYFTEKVTERAATPSTNRFNVDGTAYTINSAIAVGPITSSNQGYDPGSFFIQRDSHAKVTSYAAFGQVNYTPAGFDALHLTVGARYTHDKRDGILTKVIGKPSNFPFHFAKGRVDPLAIVALDATRDLHLYAKYSTGYRAGGANSRSQTFTSFGPEVVKAYEIGAKTDLLDHRVRLNVAAYLMNRTGTQEDFDNVDTIPTSPTFNLHTEETRNAPGISKIRGLEADLTISPIRDLTLSASYAYTHTKVPAIANPFLPGNPLFQVFVVYTPKYAASAAIDYQLPTSFADAKIRFHLDANYAGRQYTFQAENVKSDESFIVNGRIALTNLALNNDGTKATLSVWSRNLLNEAHIYRRSGSNRGTLGDYSNFNAPRTFGIEAAMKF